MVESWKLGLEMSNTTKIKLLTVLFGVMERSRKRHGLPINPVREVVKPRRAVDPRSSEIQFYSPEEVLALVHAAESEQDAAIFLTAAFTGLRRSELVALRWRDVDFPNSVIRVAASFTEGHLTTPKSGRVRAVPMAPEVTQALARLNTSARTCATRPTSSTRTSAPPCRFRQPDQVGIASGKDPRAVFDSADSAQVKSVYDYFAVYQARLAVLLTEYFHARPDVYSPQTVQNEVNNLQAKVTAQAQSLKPSVPEGAVVDQRTGLMWTQHAALRNLHELAFVVADYSPTNWPGAFAWRTSATSTGVNGLPFTNWSLPTLSQITQGLISGWSGDNPLGWLRKEARFGPPDRAIFLRDTYDEMFRLVRTGSGPFVFKVMIKTFDLRQNKLEGRIPAWAGPSNPNDTSFPVASTSQEAFKKYVRVAIYLRQPAAGETYWWN